MYKVLAIIGAFVVSVGVSGYYMYQAGGDNVRAELAEELAKANIDDNRKAKEVIKWKEKTKVVYRDRVQKIKVAADPTGCLDMDLRDVGLGGMLQPDSN